METLLQSLVGLGLFLVGLAGLEYVSVEGIKKFMQTLQASFESVSWLTRPLALLTPQGNKTFFLALIVAFVYVAGFDINVFGDFSEFEGVNPTILNLMQSALVAYGGHLVNKRE